MSELSNAVDAFDDAVDKIDRCNNLFGYETPDERDPKYEHVHGRDLFIEVGGPCTHIKIYVSTRKEHGILKEALDKILSKREADANKRLDSLCAKRMEQKEGTKCQP